MNSLILVVEDDRAARIAIVDILKDAGFPSLEAARASEALLLLEKHPSVSLLFTDTDMPVINGYVLADMAVTRWPHLRVLYSSGSLAGRAVGEQPGLLHGEILAKPYRAEQLTLAIAGTLARSVPPDDGCGRRRDRPSLSAGRCG